MLPSMSTIASSKKCFGCRDQALIRVALILSCNASICVAVYRLQKSPAVAGQRYGIEFNGSANHESLAIIGGDGDDILQININATELNYGGLPIYLKNIEQVNIDGYTQNKK